MKMRLRKKPASLLLAREPLYPKKELHLKEVLLTACVVGLFCEKLLYTRSTATGKN